MITESGPEGAVIVESDWLVPFGTYLKPFVRRASVSLLCGSISSMRAVALVANRREDLCLTVMAFVLLGPSSQGHFLAFRASVRLIELLG